MIRRFALIENSLVTNVIEVEDTWPEGVDITDIDPQPGIGWSYDGAVFSPPPVEASPALPPVVQHPDGSGPFLTNFAFDMRFTLPERIAIKQLAVILPGMSEQQITTALAVQVNLERAAKAAFVNPQRPETRAGVMMFVQLGVLTEARALEILDAPIEAHEMYRA